MDMCTRGWTIKKDRDCLFLMHNTHHPESRRFVLPGLASFQCSKNQVKLQSQFAIFHFFIVSFTSASLPSPPPVWFSMRPFHVCRMSAACLATAVSQERNEQEGKVAAIKSLQQWRLTDVELHNFLNRFVTGVLCAVRDGHPFEESATTATAIVTATEIVTATVTVTVTAAKGRTDGRTPTRDGQSIELKKGGNNSYEVQIHSAV